MPIVSWEPIHGNVQRVSDLRSVKFMFTDELGAKTYTASKHYPQGMDFEAEASRLAVIRNAQLAENEAAKYADSLSDDMAPRHQTKLQTQKSALKIVLEQKTLLEVLPMLSSVAFIKSKSDAQIKAALDITDAQLAQLRDWQADMEIVHRIDKNYEALL